MKDIPKITFIDTTDLDRTSCMDCNFNMVVFNHNDLIWMYGLVLEKTVHILFDLGVGKIVHILFDLGSTHNFVNAKLVEKLGVETQPSEPGSETWTIGMYLIY